MKKTIGNRTTRWFCVFAIFLWMLLIFYLSSQTASHSTQTSGLFVDFFADIFGISPDNFFINIVRKSAHLFEYFVLGALVFLYESHRRYLPYVRFLKSIGFCTLYAASDELHQYFVEGRACRLTDIGIDAFGSLLGILLVFLIIALIRVFKKGRKQ